MTSSSQSSFAMELVDEQVFRDKFRKLPGIIGDWIGGEIDVGRSALMDFGCGVGVTALGVALQLKPRKVIGLDVDLEYLHCLPVARQRLGLEALPANLEFRSSSPGRLVLDEPLDCVFSWSVFEHVDQDLLGDVAQQMSDALRPGGLKLLQVAPLFFSAYGSHLGDFIRTPWAHLTRQHSKLKDEVFRPPAGEGAEQRRRREAAWSCYETLNRVTADELVAAFRDRGFELLREHRTFTEAEPPRSLTSIFNPDVLRTEQVVLLFRKTAE